MYFKFTSDAVSENYICSRNQNGEVTRRCGNINI